MRDQDGFSVVELLMALVIAGVLLSFATPTFFSGDPDCSGPDARQSAMVRTKISQISGDLGKIHIAASTFELSNNRYPDSLAEIGLDDLRDPWGNPYQYLVVFGRTDKGPVRKDHNLKPVNTGYDV